MGGRGAFSSTTDVDMEDEPWLQRLVSNIVALPDEAQCKTCKLFDITYPEVIKRWVEEMGRNLADAACYCRPPHRVKVEQQRLPYKDD